MAINNITQTISTIPEAAHRGVDVQTAFVIKQEDFQDHLQGITVDELNTLKDQLNSRIGEINSTTTTMNGYASTASAGASTATTKAGEASTSASDALSYKNQAETFKNNASASATKASQWSDNNYNVEVETGRYSAKHWSTVAQNTLGTKVDKVTSTDNAIVRFNGTTGEVQNSGVVIDDNGNVGIGTNSPSSSLTIKDGLTLMPQFGNSTPRPAITNGVQKYGVHAGTSPGDEGFLRLSAGGGTNAYAKSYIDISGYSTISDTNMNIVFGSGGAERMRIDAYGNVGIGVIPNSITSGYKTLQINGSSGLALMSSGNDTHLSTNAYYNSGYKYQTSGVAASDYSQASGNHYWKTAPSGTAGSDITWTNAMTLDTSGNLGLAATPSTLWHSNTKVIQIKNASFGSNVVSQATIRANNIYDGTASRYISGAPATTYDSVNGTHAWYTAPSGTAGSAITWTNAMTLDTSGTTLVELNNGTDSSIRLGYKNGVDRNINIRGNTGTNTSLTFTESGVADRYTIGCMSGDGSLHFKKGLSLATGTTMVRFDSGGNSITQGSIIANDGRSLVTYANSDVQFLGLNNDTIFGCTGAHVTKIYTNGVERLKVDSNGNVVISSGSLLLTSGTGALGYGTGAGGTVTQLTSKSTEVTLNKPTGQITMNNAALAAGAKIEFQLGSTVIQANDLVYAVITGGVSDSRTYKVESVNTVSGFSWIRLTNLSAGSLSEAVQIQFAVIKGAIS